ncbi:MAG: hypothetical protein M3340_13815 [Actinomycetota bacterium]|nr:hypothetical protein [Actinomycetota bacterium]
MGSWSHHRPAVRVDIRRGTGGSRGERDRLRSVEGASGGDGRDRLVGDGRANHLLGGPRSDVLVGRGGRDRLNGGSTTAEHAGGEDRAVDRLACGAGTDRIDDVAVDPTPRDAPRDTVLDPVPRDCEVVGDSEYLSADELVKPHPRRDAERRVSFDLSCPFGDASDGDCRRRVVLRHRGAELGRSETVTIPHGQRAWITVRLARPLPRRGTVVVRVEGESYDTYDEAWYRYAIRYALGFGR